MSNITFDDLFAYRFQYQDYTMDEHSIIQKLKLILLNNNMTHIEIDDYLFLFYVAFGHPITFEEIQSINISPFYINLHNIPLHNINEEDEEILINTVNTNIIPINTDNMNISTEIPVNIIESLSTESIHMNTTNDITINPDNFILSMNNLNQISNMLNILYGINNSIPIPIVNIFNPSVLTNSMHMNDIVVTTDDDYLDKIKNIEVKETIMDKCSICLMSIDSGDTMLDIECKHCFHKECLLEYLKKYNHICPICRKEIGNSKVNY